MSMKIYLTHQGPWRFICMNVSPVLTDKQYFTPIGTATVSKANTSKFSLHATFLCINFESFEFIQVDYLSWIRHKCYLSWKWFHESIPLLHFKDIFNEIMVAVKIKNTWHQTHLFVARESIFSWFDSDIILKRGAFNIFYY